MNNTIRSATNDLPLAQIRQAPQPTVADQVFDELHTNILALTLPPLTKISETEVARQMGVSRQPVREAFKRLAKLGFLVIRPQASTTVSLISEKAIMRAHYIRAALEMQTCRTACEKIDSDGLAQLSKLIDQQEVAIANQDRHTFHALDDQFHREICELSGVGYVWDLIHESKGHMDRIRMLSLTTASQKRAFNEHIQMLDAISNNNPDAAAESIKLHLSRIETLITEIKETNHNWFTET